MEDGEEAEGTEETGAGGGRTDKRKGGGGTWVVEGSTGAWVVQGCRGEWWWRTVGGGAWEERRTRKSRSEEVVLGFSSYSLFSEKTL